MAVLEPVRLQSCRYIPCRNVTPTALGSTGLPNLGEELGGGDLVLGGRDGMVRANLIAHLPPPSTTCRLLLAAAERHSRSPRRTCRLGELRGHERNLQAARGREELDSESGCLNERIRSEVPGGL